MHQVSLPNDSKIWPFQKCCFCVNNLRLASLIIANLSLVGSVLMSLSTLFQIIVLAPLYKQQGDSMFLILCINLGLSVMNLVTSIMLFIALNRHNRKDFKKYIVFTTISLLINTIVYICAFAAGQWSATINVILSFVPGIYFLLVVKSYYLRMDEDKYSRAGTVYDTFNTNV